jgi:UDPglucose 6-dehydrogenase
MANLTIGFAGLSHLGIVSGLAAAEKGFNVIGFDEDESLTAMLSAGDTPVVEPGLLDLISGNGPCIEFTSQTGNLSRCDVVYIARDVPTDNAGLSDVSAIAALIETVTPHVRDDAAIVVLCQVPPGFTRRLWERDSRFFYQVETLIFGRAVERALYPERLIIGKAAPGIKLPPAYRTFLEAFDCQILDMQFESAELTKISINMCLVASISVANTMAAMCEKIGADWSEIVPALRLDARIGPHAYLKPGLGLAGGNLERDLATVQKIAREHDCDHGIVDAWIHNSKIRKDWAWQTLQQLVLGPNPAARIAILGLAYKENTHSVKNAASLALLSEMQGLNVVVYDPVVDANTVAPGVEFAATALEAVDGADAVVIITPWPEFSNLGGKQLVGTMRGKVLLDPYVLVSEEDAVSAGLTYATLGKVQAAIGKIQNA